MKEEPLFYMRDSRSNLGSNVVFWRNHGSRAFG